MCAIDRASLASRSIRIRLPSLTTHIIRPASRPALCALPFTSQHRQHRWSLKHPARSTGRAPYARTAEEACSPRTTTVHGCSARLHRTRVSCPIASGDWLQRARVYCCRCSALATPARPSRTSAARKAVAPGRGQGAAPPSCLLLPSSQPSLPQNSAQHRQNSSHNARQCSRPGASTARPAPCTATSITGSRIGPAGFPRAPFTTGSGITLDCRGFPLYGAGITSVCPSALAAGCGTAA